MVAPSLMTTSPNLATALALAGAGLSVFPCHAGGDKAKQPMPFIRWRDVSTTSESQIRQWWQKWPNAAIGLDLGKCGLLVVDADRHGEHDGVEAWGTVMAAHGFDPDSAPLVATPNQGNHHFFRQPADRQLGNGRGSLPPGVDVRGDGGYVIAPGTVMADGRVYELFGYLGAAPAIPDWLSAILEERRADIAKPISAPAFQPAAGNEIEELLSYIPPDLGYHDWIAVLMALHAVGASIDLADAWSARGSKYKGRREIEQKWRSFKRSGTTSRTLAMLAGQYGAPLDEIAIRHNGPDPAIEEENRRYAAMLTLVAGKPVRRDTDPEPVDYLNIVRASQFASLETPTRRFLDARELIPMANVTSIYGDGATGKSLLALQLAMAVATGAPWLGRPVEHGNVLYFSAEDDEIETHIRLKEICAAEGIDLSQASGLQIALLAGQSAVLAEEDGKHATMKPTALFAALERRLASSVSRLVILDNLADIFAGNENARPLARQFIGMLRGLAIRYDCAVVLLAHPSMSGINNGTGSSGNLAWGNSVRSRLYLRRVLSQDGQTIMEDDPCMRELDTKKMNYGPSGSSIRLRWEDHRFVAVDEPRNDNGDPFAQSLKAERVFMHLLRWHLRHNKYVSPNKSGAWAPRVFADHPQAEGVRSKQFEKAMSILLEHGQIRIASHGSPSNLRQHIDLPAGRFYDDP